MNYKRSWLDLFFCRVGWHRKIGITIGDFIRCYACGCNLHVQDGTWRRDMPPDLRPTHTADAVELRRVLEDLTIAFWNHDLPLLPEYDAAMIALGYRLDGITWVRP